MRPSSKRGCHALSVLRRGRIARFARGAAALFDPHEAQPYPHGSAVAPEVLAFVAKPRRSSWFHAAYRDGHCTEIATERRFFAKLSSLVSGKRILSQKSTFQISVTWCFFDASTSIFSSCAVTDFLWVQFRKKSVHSADSHAIRRDGALWMSLAGGFDRLRDDFEALPEGLPHGVVYTGRRVGLRGFQLGGRIRLPVVSGCLHQVAGRVRLTGRAEPSAHVACASRLRVGCRLSAWAACETGARGAGRTACLMGRVENGP